jgi:HCOMODA/2-hydroxy-3-carboxy-muconic semialdehyde decarboxylase
MEMNARLQQQAMALGPVTYLEPEEARRADATVSGTYTRPWELWKRRVAGR